MDLSPFKNYERKTARRARAPVSEGSISTTARRARTPLMRTPRDSEASTSTSSSHMYGDVRKEVSSWSLFSFRNTQSLSSLPSSNKSGGGYNQSYNTSNNYNYYNNNTSTFLMDRNTPPGFASRKHSSNSELSLQLEPSSPVDDDFIYGDAHSVNSNTISVSNSSRGSLKDLRDMPRSPSHRSLSPAGPRSPSVRGPSPVAFGAVLKEVKLLNDELNAALLSHEKAEEVLTLLAEYIEGILGNITISQDSAKIYAELFKESGTIELVVETQRTHSQTARAQTIAGRAIKALSEVHANIAHEIGISGGVQLLVDALRHHADDETFFLTGIEHTLKAIANLIGNAEKNNRSNREYMADCNGMEVIISIMGRYSDTPVIQSTGAQIMACGVLDSQSNIDSIIAGFGLDVLITSMRGLPKEAQVQEWACAALYNICIFSSSNSDKKDNRDNLERIGRKGGVNAIIEALGVHYDNREVVEAASKALHSLVMSTRTNLERMSNSSEWIQVLITILEKYENECNIQIWLLAILGEAANNANESSEMKNENGRKDGNENKKNGREKKEEEKVVKRRIRNNSNSTKKKGDVAKELVERGALQTAINGMRRNANDSAVLVAGAKTARALLDTGIQHLDSAIKQAGGIALLIDLLMQAANNHRILMLQPPTSSVTTEQTNNERRIITYDENNNMKNTGYSF